jgi:HD-GYP domain-containing protein (c-di-GMP phosphodiesterase class II)
LAIPALLLSSGYTRWGTALERRVRFAPGGWLVVVAGVLVGSYAVLAISRSDLVASLPLSEPPASYGLAVASSGLFLFAAWRQYGLYRSARLALQGTLVLAYVLLAEAQLLMVLSVQWTLAWWEYHLVMLAAVALALRAIAVERVRGRSLRAMFEVALQLEVEIGAEINDMEALATIAAAIEAKLPHLKGHQGRVANLAVRIGKELGLSQPRLRVIARAALLRDIGKLSLPDDLASNPGPYSSTELALLRTHPQHGFDVLSSSSKFAEEANIVLAHHERVDGRGHPRGLRGEQIPLEARVIAVAEAYDTHLTEQPFRKPLSPRIALGMVRAVAGRQLDAEVVETLARVVGGESVLESRLGSRSEPTGARRGVPLATDVS